ncbi:MAG: hypothetical protein L6V93_19875 [Clostridiales bacterium]|nr:MAG: hypothetical protein L6V93_19875 [Clostridiales bacterium]
MLISIYEIFGRGTSSFRPAEQGFFDIAYAFSGKISAADVNEKRAQCSLKTVVKSKIYAMAMSLEHLANMYFTSEKVSADLEKKTL